MAKNPLQRGAQILSLQLRSRLRVGHMVSAARPGPLVKGVGLGLGRRRPGDSGSQDKAANRRRSDTCPPHNFPLTWLRPGRSYRSVQPCSTGRRRLAILHKKVAPDSGLRAPSRPRADRGSHQPAPSPSPARSPRRRPQGLTSGRRDASARQTDAFGYHSSGARDYDQGRAEAAPQARVPAISPSPRARRAQRVCATRCMTGNGSPHTKVTLAYALAHGRGETRRSCQSARDLQQAVKSRKTSEADQRSSSRWSSRVSV